MDMNFNRAEYLIPLSLATGAFDSKEAFLFTAYYGLPVISDKKSKCEYFNLENAIKFNQLESESASGIEKQYRELLKSELENIKSFEQVFSYSDQLLKLWAVVFRKQSEEILKSRSKKIDQRMKALIKEAIS